MISEDKDGVSEGESGGSIEDHQDRHQVGQQPGQHPHHSHYPLHHQPHGHVSNGIVQYTANHSDDSNTPFFVPSMSSLGGSVNLPGSPQDESSRKREIRLLKNREAARECRRKKKEYIKCLENRVAVLENQNKALIEELKSLKELYTGGSKLM